MESGDMELSVEWLVVARRSAGGEALRERHVRQWLKENRRLAKPRGERETERVKEEDWENNEFIPGS